jgi:4-alpha-glucanotransferase
VVRRGVRAEGVSVIAGYPWFSDWGRDAMISLPGLLLATERFDEALGVLQTFARAQRRGLIPNRFDDYGGENHYNTVDGSLWFVHACAAYLRASGDREGFDSLVPACLRVILAYEQGTDYDIAMDPADGLIRAGNEHTQLTWMDAQRGGITFTPRHGKAVEINALWFNALTLLAEALPDHDACARLSTLAERAGASFVRAFVNPGSGLLDCLTPTDEGWEADTSVRPNQIFAASLPHSPLSLEQRREVVRVVRERLLTPVGLRTLDPSDPAYRGRYEGDLMARDAAYHNGTVWPWLLGAYAEAVMRADGFSERSRAEAGDALRPLIAWLESGWSPAQLPEIFDGDETPDAPREPDGCPAQAWSVAETLRVWVMSLAGPDSPGLTP